MVTWAQIGWVGLGVVGIVVVIWGLSFLLRIGAAMFTDKVD